MLNTSSDILNISIAAAVVALAVFVCWSLYYLIANLKKINKISNQLESGVSKAEQLIDLLKRKVGQSSSYIFVLGKLAEKALDYFNKKGRDKKEKGKKEK
jgi:hypothetical protein